jgi:hypothetical protein
MPETTIPEIVRAIYIDVESLRTQPPHVAMTRGVRDLRARAEGNARSKRHDDGNIGCEEDQC